MRIVCERCSAAFAVDDNRIPESGARAACPRCKQPVILRRDGPVPSPPDPLAQNGTPGPRTTAGGPRTTASGRDPLSDAIGQTYPPPGSEYTPSPPSTAPAGSPLDFQVDYGADPAWNQTGGYAPDTGGYSQDSGRYAQDSGGYATDSMRISSSPSDFLAEAAQAQGWNQAASGATGTIPPMPPDALGREDPAGELGMSERIAAAISGGPERQTGNYGLPPTPSPPHTDPGYGMAQAPYGMTPAGYGDMSAPQFEIGDLFNQQMANGGAAPSPLAMQYGGQPAQYNQGTPGPYAPPPQGQYGDQGTPQYAEQGAPQYADQGVPQYTPPGMGYPQQQQAPYQQQSPFAPPPGYGADFMPAITNGALPPLQMPVPPELMSMPPQATPARPAAPQADYGAFGEASSPFAREQTGSIPTAEIVSTGPISRSGPSMPEAPSTDEWRVKKPESIVEGPFTSAELVARYEAGLIQGSDLVAQGNDRFQALSAYPLTATFMRAKPAGVREVRAFASSERGPFPWRGFLTTIAIIVGALGGAFIYASHPSWLFGAGVSPADQGALAIIEGWREKEPQPIASARELFQLARGYYALDTREGFRHAADAYKRVLIKNPTDIKAMAGFAEVRAIVAIEEGDPVGVQESAELLAYALRHGSNTPAPLVARANLWSTTGTASDLILAQQAADNAHRIAPDDVDVLLAVGRASIATNAEAALTSIEKARKLDATQRAIPVLLGQAYLSLGRIGEARAAFEERRKAVPDDTTADLLLANLDASVGRFERARQRLNAVVKQTPKSIDARLLSAILTYEIDGDLKRAHDEFAAIRAMPLDRKRKLRVLIHSAAVAQEMGKTEETETLVKSGQDLDSDSAALHYRLALLRLAQNRGEDAKAQLAKAADQMPDAADREVLLGRILASLGQIDAAQGRFSRGMVLSPHEPTAYLLGAAMYAQIGALPPALVLIRRALNADPSWSASHRSITEFHDGGSSLRLAVGAFESMATGQEEVALVNGALAVARYQIGDIVGSERAAQAAVSTGDDTEALAARIYLGQLALDRKKPVDALREMKAAADIERHCPTVPYLMGRALAQLQHFEEAHAKFREALEQDINFLPAKVRDAEVLARIGQKEDAMKLYKEAFKSDPEDLDVRRGLDALEEGELPPTLDSAIEVENQPQAP